MFLLSLHGRFQKSVRCILLGLPGFFVCLTANEGIACPFIVEHPVSVMAELRQPVTFSVVVGQTTPRLPVTVQWRRNGVDIPGALTIFPRVLENVTADYTIQSAMASDAGIYSAVVFDAECSEQSKKARLEFPQLPVLPVSDVFEKRGTIGGPTGTGTGFNCDAVSEPGAPRNDNLPGGKMVWLRWISPGHGVVTFDTRGSDFDTTLGIYRIKTPGPAVVTNLAVVAGDDDSGGFLNSKVRFNATEEGQAFEIGIDGYYGRCGNFTLNWSFVSASQKIPEITNHPKSYTALPLEDIFLSVDVKTNANSPPLRYKWFFNGNAISEATQRVLAIPRVHEASVGQYQVRVEYADQAPEFAVFSKRAQIQINLEGNRDASAGPKLCQVADTNVYLNGPGIEMVPVRGFTGTHIFNTYGSLHEPGEPDHCGQAGGSSFWYSCQPTDTGTLTVDAYTPTYDCVLAVYVWPGLVGDYEDIVPVACASATHGPGHEIVEFPVTAETIYYLVVDGASGAYGPVTLNMTFEAPPQILTDPVSRTVTLGSSPVLTVSASGVPSPTYQWRIDGVVFPGKTNASMTLKNFQATDQCGYDVVVTNCAGAVTSAVATLYLDDPLRFGSISRDSTNGFSFQLFGKANSNYVLQATEDLIETNWFPLFTNSSPYGILQFIDTNLYLFSNRYYRAVRY